MSYVNEEMVAAIRAANKALLDGEPGNHTKADPNGYVGYDPQAVMDAANLYLGAENWAYTVADIKEMTVKSQKGDKTAYLIRLGILLRVNGEMTLKAETFAFQRDERGDPGDAIKGAISSAVKRGLAMIGIGGRAYSGDLQPAQATGQAQPRRSAPAQDAPPPARQTKAPTPAPGAEVSVDELAAMAVQAGFEDLDAAITSARLRSEDIDKIPAARANLAKRLQAIIQR